MQWSPVAVRGRDGIADWTEQWVCTRCSRTCAPSDQPVCAHCRRPLQWEYDTFANLGEWRCSNTSCLPDLGDFAPPAVTPARPAVQHSNESERIRADRLQYAEWTMVGPPQRIVTSMTNSFMYVPLLLDAAGLLRADAAQAWRAHPASSGWWQLAVDTLSTSPGVSVNLLVPQLSGVLRASG